MSAPFRRCSVKMMADGLDWIVSFAITLCWSFHPMIKYVWEKTKDKRENEKNKRKSFGNCFVGGEE